MNQYAVGLVKEAFHKQGYKTEASSLPAAQVSFAAISKRGKSMKIRVKACREIGSYVFCTKKNFNIKDNNLYMAMVYLQANNKAAM